MSDGREHDIVLWGATGFTGRLVAEYLQANANGARWAIGGRNRDKLEALRTELGLDVPVIVADSFDAASLDAMVRSTRVVCTTVGPYTKYGTPLVEACATAGTHYCDLTGEVPWMHTTIAKFHDVAKSTGARIVHCCGFDSIPSDLGVFMIYDHLSKQGRGIASAQLHVERVKGGMSGGTVASMVGILEAARNRETRRVLLDPYALDPKDSPRGDDRGDQTGPRYDSKTGRWTAPFLMAGINTRIVRRSNALMAHAYGRSFRYREVMDTGSGMAGRMRAYGLSAALGAFAAGMSAGRSRAALTSFVLPEPGEGPTREQRDNGYFVIGIHAQSDGSPALRVKGVVKGVKDPGYGETAKMLAESALCLAKDDLTSDGGVLTPATAMGMTLVERLRAAGMTFRVDLA